GWSAVLVAVGMSNWWFLDFVSPVAAPLITLFLVIVLPRRRNRSFGRRRGARQLLAIGWIIGLVGAIATELGLLVVAWPITFSFDLVALAGITIVECVVWFVIGYSVIVVARRAERQPTLEAVLAEDPRPPVLYVRPFDTERLPFVFGEWYRYRAFYQGAGRPAKGSPLMIALENYLSKPIGQTIGPFVALGSPEDLIPTTGGAVRTYATDDTWQQEFNRLAQSAAAIVVEVRESANLSWELEHIRRCNLQERLIVLTEHPTWRRLKSAVLWAWLESLMGFARPSWSVFASTAGRLGYDVLRVADPGPGSLITFDDKGRGMVLTTTADLPMDYAQSIHAHVASIVETRRASP
ncbi:MAG: hypothetical protein ACRD3J_21865, partial [Thermoanaerobaculia bacterium]